MKIKKITEKEYKDYEFYENATEEEIKQLIKEDKEKTIFFYLLAAITVAIIAITQQNAILLIGFEIIFLALVTITNQQKSEERIALMIKRTTKKK